MNSNDDTGQRDSRLSGVLGAPRAKHVRNGSTGANSLLLAKAASEDLPVPKRQREAPPPMPSIPTNLLSHMHTSPPEFTKQQPELRIEQPIHINPRNQSHTQVFDDILKDLDTAQTQIETMRKDSSSVPVRTDSTTSNPQRTSRNQDQALNQTSHSKKLPSKHVNGNSYDELKRLLDAKDLFEVSLLPPDFLQTSRKTSEVSTTSIESAEARRLSLEKSLHALKALANMDNDGSAPALQVQSFDSAVHGNMPPNRTASLINSSCESAAKSKELKRDEISKELPLFAERDVRTLSDELEQPVAAYNAKSYSLERRGERSVLDKRLSLESGSSKSTFSSDTSKSSSESDSDTEPLGAALLRVALKSPDRADDEVEDNKPLSRSNSKASSRKPSARISKMPRDSGSKQVFTSGENSLERPKSMSKRVSQHSSRRSSKPADRSSKEHRHKHNRHKHERKSAGLRASSSTVASPANGSDPALGLAPDSATLMELHRQQLLQQDIQIQLQKKQLADLQQQQAALISAVGGPSSALKANTLVKHLSPPIGSASSLIPSNITPTTPATGAATGAFAGLGLINSAVFGSNSSNNSLSRTKSVGNSARGKLARPGAHKRKLQKAGTIPNSTLLNLDDVKNCRLCGCSEFRRRVGSTNPNICSRCYHDHNDVDQFDPDEGTNVDYERRSMRPV